MSSDLLHVVRGCTFDDFLLTPQRGIVPTRDPARIDLSARVSERITLRRPLASANMDTVTRAARAVAVAEEGGLGVIGALASAKDASLAWDLRCEVRENLIDFIRERHPGCLPQVRIAGPAAADSAAAAM
jgi:hypothetical protein